LARGPPLDQAVDEHAQPARGRGAAGRGVRRREQADLLEVREDVADRGRTDVEPGVARQRLRSHRLAVADVASDQRPQQLPGAWVQVVLVVDPAGHGLDICPRRRGRKRSRRSPAGSRASHRVQPPPVIKRAGIMPPWSSPRPTSQSARMLTHLAIRDFAVVTAAELEFGAGLTVISGETGAGKSLLVDALGFLSGLRADSGMVRHGARRAELHAEFDLAAADAARQWLREEEFDDGDACQLRRTLRADGGSRAWINGRPATLSQLAALAERLVEIHGQHEHQALLSRPSQLALLDACGGHAAQLAAVADAARHWS